MIVPDPNFRPNPGRAVYVQGKIDQNLVDRLTPRIIALTAQNRSPITVYIDSRGGSVSSAEHLLRLLHATNQDGDDPCWLITVVTGTAASAAADLLSSGSYALALPETLIHYHGVRTSFIDPLTQESASALSERLKLSNDRYAMMLARKSEWRFMFRYIALRDSFGEHRKKVGNEGLTELECFLEMVREKISKQANQIIDQAQKRYERYNALLDYVFKVKGRRTRIFERGRSTAEMEGFILKAIIGFELKDNKHISDWTFRDGGLSRIHDDFFLLNEYIGSVYSDQFRSLCHRWGHFVLSEDDNHTIDALPDAEKSDKKVELLRPIFQPFWSFFVALCHALQEGENQLSALDAFWLGLIDEVIGVSDLPLTRYISEFKPDPEPDESVPPAPASNPV